MRWVLVGYSCGAAGMVFVAQRGHLPDSISISLATLLLAAWNFFLYFGVADLLGARRRMGRLLLVSLPPLLLLTNYFVYIQGRLTERIIVFSAVSILQYLLLALLVLRNGNPRTRMPRFGMAFLFVLWSVAHLLRAVYTLQAKPVSMLDEVTTSRFVIVLPAIVGILTCLAFLWLAMAQLQGELEQQSHTDSLTGLLNRRALEALAQREIARAGRVDSPLSLIICDLDLFKLVNDRFGHDGGDSALAAAAACILDGLRANDVVARLGGEEFVMLLPGTGEAGAVLVAERLRCCIADLTVQHRSHPITLSASFGIALLQPSDGDWEDILHRADRALYRAKAEGRNRTAVFDPNLDTSSNSSLHARAADQRHRPAEPEGQAV
jgi:diguanylate cyclase (GGDEF)-like protein